MTTVFHAWPYGRFIKSNLGRKKLHRKNQGSNFLRGSFSNRGNVRVPIQFRRGSQPLFRLTNLKSLVLFMGKWIGLFLRKYHLLRSWGWISLLNWIGALTLSLLLKLPPRKLEPWLLLWSFFLLRLLCISINLPYDHVWNTVVIVDKLQKRICRNVVPSLAASLEPLAHRQNVASLTHFYRYYFGRCSSELANWFHFLILEGGLLVNLIDCMIVLSPFLDVTFLAQLNSGILCL